MDLERERVAGFAGLASRALEPPSSLPEGLAAHLGVDRPRFVQFLDRQPAKTRAAARTITPEQRLIQRSSMGFNQYEQELIEELGYQGYLERQLHPEELDDAELTDAIAENLPSISLEPFDLLEGYVEEPFRPVIELQFAAIYRALFSTRQLYERMVTFWTDHFNIDIYSGIANFLKPTDDREVVRAHAMGRFPDLLRTSAHSPAMLIYLTNDSNHKDLPNENYARELMELHTMGADNGYTQEDVREVARCFTGWTVWGRDGGRRIGRFRFVRQIHDDGDKVVLGRHIPAGGGVEDGEAVLRILAEHPNTARFIATKLLRYLWGYEPPKNMIDKVAARYLDTGGDIRSMLRLILRRGWMSRATPKVKRPFHLLVSALRGLFGGEADARFLWETLNRTGQLPFAWHPPNGYPDSAEYWSGFLLPRWNFAGEIAFQELARRPDDVREILALGSRSKIVDAIDWLFFNRTLPARTRRALVHFMHSDDTGPQLVLETIGLAMASPEFQQY